MSHKSSFRWLLGIVGGCAIVAGCDAGLPPAPSSVYVSSVSPNTGSMLGATRVTIAGGGFKSGATVQFGGVPATTSAVSADSITAEAPAHAAGAVTVTVTNPDSRSGTLPGGFTYEIDPAFIISGVITELLDGQDTPVEGVRVTESATHTWATTDVAGAYRLPGLRRSNFSLLMSAAGYDALTTQVTATSDLQVDRRITRIPHFVLSGMVYETTPAGRVPLDGVLLYCDGCGSPVGHTHVRTDANGFYRLEWTRNGKNWIQFLEKDGYRYVGPIEQLGIPVIVNGDTRFDIELVKR